MKFLFYFLSVLCLVHEIFCVRVTLENGATGTVNKEIEINKPGTLPCSYSSTRTGGTADVKWTNGKNLVHYNDVVQDRYVDRFSFQSPASLLISSAEKQDAGMYKCEVTIPQDDPQIGDGTYNLTIIIPPSIPVCQFPSDHALTLGFTTELKCFSQEGIPAPAYTWYKDNQPLPLNSQNDARYKNMSYSYNSQTGVLTFAKVNSADAGTYYCEAANKLGKESCTPAKLVTKEQDIGMIVGIVFGCVFGVLLIGLLIWWTWRKGYCDGFTGSDDDAEIDGDDANDVMLDSHGPIVTKPPSEFNGSTGKGSMAPGPDGGVKVMP